MFNYKDLNTIKEKCRYILNSFSDSINDTQKIISVTIDINGERNKLINEINPFIKPYFFQSQKVFLYGLIDEYNFIFNTNEDYKSKKNHMLDIISSSFFINSEINNKTYLFGGLNFDLNNKNYNIWKNTPVANFVLPRYIINEDKLIINFYNNSNLSKTESFNILNQYINDLDCIFKLKKEDYNKSNLIDIKDLITKSNYHEKLNMTIRNLKFKSSELSKVIHSRMKKVSFTKNVPLLRIFKNLIFKNKQSMTFLYTISKEVSTIGSSPELILSKSSNVIKSESIAGSNFSRERDDFKSDSKEVYEQKIVTDYILDFFNKNSINVKYNSIPSIKKSSKIEHLCTSFSATLKNKKNILDLLSEIHPTPAIGGYPKQKAIDNIRNFKENRGWYGGPIGWIDNSLDGRFYLNIRSGMSLENDLYLFSGSGITEKSIAKNEWEETEHKFKLMIDSL
ncbi:MAG: hypothetical protein CBE33_03040 [Candidatus Pelagibacter sp. TMED273]|mgnify:CR=1 FL=1|nr:MAG: hypothetical protein CBE33_03040 [Candidatus Pelagibacter sp. TMED273]|tara:strand:- start:3209 stop:4564 length:1356 start_codon:yes stop_codon:yes gene_type:complete